MDDPENVKTTIPKNTSRRDSQTTTVKSFSHRRSPMRLAIAVAVSVFFCEAVVMVVIQPFYHLPPWMVALIDGISLALILSPLLYLFVFRPMVRHIDELRQAKNALRESENRFRTVFHTSPDSISISRLEDGRLVDVNEGFSVLTGYPRDEVLGMSTLEIPLWDDIRAREEMIARLQKNDLVNNFEAKIRSKDNRLVDALISARVITLKEEPHILAVVREITELKQTENTLRVARNFLQIANRHTEAQPLLKEFLDQIQRLSGGSAAGIRLLDADGNIPYAACEGFSPEFYASENSRTIDDIGCMCSDAIMGRITVKQGLLTAAGSFCLGSTSRLLNTLSEAEMKRLCDVCGSYGYESVALIPIHLTGKITGLIHLADNHTDKFSPSTVEIVEGAAMQLGIALERVKAEEALLKSNRELECRVKERTAELDTANRRLISKIEEHKITEEKLRKLSAELHLAEERERRRIANVLHDRIGQSLSVARINIGKLREGMASINADKNLIDDIRQHIEQTIEDTRSLTFELGSPILYELGLEAALKKLAKQTQEKYELQIELKDDGKSKSLDNDRRVIAYQAARELLFNIVKHAQAKKALITTKRVEDTVCIDIQDDGVGCDVSVLDPNACGASGFGLFSIRERLRALGGHLAFHSEPGRGTRASLVLPLVCHTDITGD